MRSPSTVVLVVTGLLSFGCLEQVGHAEATQSAFAKSPVQLPNDGHQFWRPRELKFATDEGTWMSVDVSPDGRLVVFDLLGDLYTLPISGGRATRITRGPAVDTQPRYSPDGRSIAFISDRDGNENLWLVDTDGRNPRQLTHIVGMTHSVSPQWTPDGQSIVVSRFASPVYPPAREAGTFVVNVYNGTETLVPGTEQTWSMGAAFGRRSGQLYLGYRASAHDFGTGTIVRINPRSGERYTLASRRGGAFRPAVSSNEKYLVYGTRLVDKTALVLQDMSTGEERILIAETQHDPDERGGMVDPSWDWLPGSSFTPDGSALITSYGGKLWRVDPLTSHRIQIPFTAEVDQAIGSRVRFSYPYDDRSLVARRVRTPRVSPDGRWVAFIALDHLYLQRLPNGIPRRVTAFDGVEHSPVWSPDGMYLAFLTWDDNRGGHIYRAPMDIRCRTATSDAPGCEPELLSEESGYFDKLNYSPDGRRLVVVRGSRYGHAGSDWPYFQGSCELVWMPASGGPSSTITNLNSVVTPSGDVGTPHFKKGDEEHVYISDLSGLASPLNGVETMSLISMRWDGTDRQGLLTVKNVAQHNWADSEHDILLSPDGKQVAIASSNHIYLTALANGDGSTSTPVIDLSKASSSVIRISRIGGVFPWWASDGRSLTFSLGRTWFKYDLARADSLVHQSRTERPAHPEPAYEPSRLDLTVRVAKDRPSGAVVLRGARIITMRGGEVIEGGDVLVRNNRVVAVGPSANFPIPPDAYVLDVAGKTVMPGLIDIYNHSAAVPGVHRTQVWDYLAKLAYGVTSVRDPGAPPDVLEYMDRVEAGELLGPRIFTTGVIIQPEMAPHSLDEARQLLQTYSDYYRTNLINVYFAGNRRQHQWINIAAAEQHLTTTTSSGYEVKTALGQIIDGYAGRDHVVTIFPIYKDVATLLAASDTVYTPTLMLASAPYFIEREDIGADKRLQRFVPESELARMSLRGFWQWMDKSQYQFPQQAKSAAKIVAAGGLVGLGSDIRIFGIGSHWELWALATGGIAPLDLLRIATINGAIAIGVQKELGSLEPGKIADLLVLDKNPLDNIRNTTSIRYVMKNGRLYDSETLDEVWPRSKPLEHQYWWGQNGVGVVR